MLFSGSNTTRTELFELSSVANKRFSAAYESFGAACRDCLPTQVKLRHLSTLHGEIGAEECSENKIKYLFFHKPPPKIRPRLLLFSSQYHKMFHHLNLFLRSLPTPVPTIPKTELEKKDSTRLPNNNTHNFLRFIPHKFNEKRTRRRETGGEKGKVENLLLCSHFLLAFSGSSRKISSLNKFYVWLVSFSLVHCPL